MQVGDITMYSFFETQLKMSDEKESADHASSGNYASAYPCGLYLKLNVQFGNILLSMLGSVSMDEVTWF